MRASPFAYHLFAPEFGYAATVQFSIVHAVIVMHQKPSLTEQRMYTSSNEAGPNITHSNKEHQALDCARVYVHWNVHTRVEVGISVNLKINKLSQCVQGVRPAFFQFVDATRTI